MPQKIKQIEDKKLATEFIDVFNSDSGRSLIKEWLCECYNYQRRKYILDHAEQINKGEIDVPPECQG